MMTPYEIFQAYLNLLYKQFLYDVNVLSQPWMYYLLLIPAICYLIFVVVKWGFLTIPIWAPLNGILKGIIQTVSSIIKESKKEK